MYVIFDSLFNQSIASKNLSFTTLNKYFNVTTSISKEKWLSTPELLYQSKTYFQLFT